MEHLVIPANYRSELNLYDTQEAIKTIKDFFQQALAEQLTLLRVTAPLFVTPESGLNDNLNGIERPVDFDIKEQDGKKAEIVQSLAKWKRYALKKYGFHPGEGLYTDMNAIRADEELGNLHSLYVDQWDWERVIGEEDRNVKFLKKIVERIYAAMLRTEYMVYEMYPDLKPSLAEEIHFIHAEELLQMYPHLTPKEREHAIAKKYGAVFIIGIGSKLSNGEPHDHRAPDYDDWSTPNSDGYNGLNGDIIVWNDLLGRSFELSSMGIRVNKEVMLQQLELTGKEDRKSLYFHQRILNDTLPLCIGGGIGQSRLCMLFLKKAHIGEIQSSIWPNEMRLECREANIPLI